MALYLCDARLLHELADLAHDHLGLAVGERHRRRQAGALPAVRAVSLPAVVRAVESSAPAHMAVRPGGRVHVRHRRGAAGVAKSQIACTNRPRACEGLPHGDVLRTRQCTWRTMCRFIILAVRCEPPKDVFVERQTQANADALM
eukprot:3136361-Pyramimonas_sp.AAC.1